MPDYIVMKRFAYDFVAYLVFLGAAYVMFATSWAFRYFLIPATFWAFFSSIGRAYEEAVSGLVENSGEEEDS